MRTGINLHVTASDREWLLSIIDDRNSLQKHVWRARIVLLTADGHGTASAVPPPAELVGQLRRELRLPVPNGFVAEDDATDQEHLGPITSGGSAAATALRARWHRTGTGRGSATRRCAR
jgi:hypothetical protein